MYCKPHHQNHGHSSELGIGQRARSNRLPFKDFQKRSKNLKTFLGRHAVLCSQWFQDFIKAVCGSVSTSTVAIISSDFCLQSGSFLNPQVRRVQRSRQAGFVKLSAAASIMTKADFINDSQFITIGQSPIHNSVFPTCTPKQFRQKNTDIQTHGDS